MTNNSEELIKHDVLTNLYLTGRYNNLYFGRKSKSTVNPLKVYINRFLFANNLIIDEEDFMQLCEDCYQTIFVHLFKKPASKIIQILEESPNGSKLIATACFLVKTQCASIKKNPKHSGLFFNILNNSSYRGLPISTSEEREEDNDSLIIYDDDSEPEPFTKKYGVSVEDLLTNLSEVDREYFYHLIDVKQNRGKPNAEERAKRKDLFDKIRTIQEKYNNER